MRSRRRLALATPVLAALLGAGCGADSSSTASGGGPGGSAPTPAASAPAVTNPPVSGLPFTYEGGGQGGSPPFTIQAAGTYTVAYHLSADANGASCSMSIALSHNTESVTVIDQLTVAPGAPKDGSKAVKLNAGTWRAIEGGGCAWTLTISS